MHLGANLTVKTRLCQKKNIVKPKYCYDNENTTLCTHSSLLWPHSVHHACMFDQHHPCNLHSSDVTSSTWLQKQWFRTSLLQRMQHSSAERAITKHLAAIQNKCPISIDFLWACLFLYLPAFLCCFRHLFLGNKYSKNPHRAILNITHARFFRLFPKHQSPELRTGTNPAPVWTILPSLYRNRMQHDTNTQSVGGRGEPNETNFRKRQDKIRY